jgi:hypothetical protein
MSQADVAPWISILKAVDGVRTPIGLAALVLIILFLLYRMIFANLRLDRVRSSEVATIVSRSMTLLFWIAITALVVSILSYVLLRIFDTTETSVNDSIRQLRPGDTAAAFGAVQGLRGIADRTESYDERICESLTAFVRRNPHPASPMFVREIASDVQAAMTLLSKLNDSSRCAPLDLHGANLTRLNLPGGKLSGSDLSGATLDEANLVHADLTKSNLTATSLVEADMRNAVVKQATLTAADLTRANLSCAQLDGARGLENLDPTSTRLDGASLSGVNLRWTGRVQFSNTSNCSD